MPDDILAKPRVLQNTFPGRPDLAGKRLAIVNAVDDESDLVAVLQNAGLAQLARSHLVDLAPADQVRAQAASDLCRRAPLLGRPFQGAFALIDHGVEVHPWMSGGGEPLRAPNRFLAPRAVNANQAKAGGRMASPDDPALAAQ